MVLVLLQFAAPLVHAHVSDIGRSHGLHLHEFESLHIKSDASLTGLIAYADAAQSAIVSVGEAINAHQPDPENAPVYSWPKDLTIPEQYIVETVNFSPHEEFRFQAPVVFQHTSRAPPLSA